MDESVIAYLRSPVAIRERCGQLFALASEDKLRYFRVDLAQLVPVADYVIQVMQAQYPDGQVPFHSRWRHFEVGGRSRLPMLDQSLSGLTAVEIAQSKFDLAITSVLLDAGAGADWHYSEPETGEVFRRSEGLAVASFDAFCQGIFSSDAQFAYQADAAGLQNLTETALSKSFQVNAANPLVGMPGRLGLLQKLGHVLERHPRLFGSEQPRPGKLVNFLLSQAEDGQLSATLVLDAVLAGLSEIWPGRLAIAQVNLGDVWSHPALPPDHPTAQWVPFHKLSQWLTYSLLEPLQALGLEITELDKLTGLAEYRNGGLCVDLGLLVVKDESVLRSPQLPGSEAIVEWRALTLVLLDQIAATIRQRLGLSVEQLPLVKVLQGGTWTAGRKIATELRPTGVPPISLESDGTVF